VGGLDDKASAQLSQVTTQDRGVITAMLRLGASGPEMLTVTLYTSFMGDEFSVVDPTIVAAVPASVWD